MITDTKITYVLCSISKAVLFMFSNIQFTAFDVKLTSFFPHPQNRFDRFPSIKHSVRVF